MSNVIDKLLMLTNGDILATGGDDAHIKRDCLVRQVFSKLSEKQQDGIFEMSLLHDSWREIQRSGDAHKFSQEALWALASMSANHMKKEYQREKAQGKKHPAVPPSDDIGGWDLF